MKRKNTLMTTSIHDINHKAVCIYDGVDTVLKEKKGMCWENDGIDTVLKEKKGMCWENDGIGVEEGAWAFQEYDEENPIYCSREDLIFI